MPFEQINIELKMKKESILNESKTPEEALMERVLLGDLARIRKEKGLSQAEVARLSGNKQQEISRIENREHSPTLKTLCHIANALDIDIKFVPRY